MIGVERLTVTASDGYALAATRFLGSLPPTATIIVAGATGVQQKFYRRFAEFAAGDAYEVVTFDYRGIGASAPRRLRGFEMNFSDWARLDLASIIDRYKDHGPLFIVGHSYGGVAFGLVPNITEVDALWAFGAGAGWYGWMSGPEGLRVLALWHLAGPVLTRILGYLPGNLIGLGSDMPLGVYRGWKRWTRYRRFFFDDPKMSAAAELAGRIDLPVAAANATDDAWAPPRSRDALMAGYRSVALTTIDINPLERGLGSIGHVGYFRPSSITLWKEALSWLNGHRLLANGRK